MRKSGNQNVSNADKTYMVMNLWTVTTNIDGENHEIIYLKAKILIRFYEFAVKHTRGWVVVVVICIYVRLGDR